MRKTVQTAASQLNQWQMAGLTAETAQGKRLCVNSVQCWQHVTRSPAADQRKNMHTEQESQRWSHSSAQNSQTAAHSSYGSYPTPSTLQYWGLHRASLLALHHQGTCHFEDFKHRADLSGVLVRDYRSGPLGSKLRFILQRENSTRRSLGLEEQERGNSRLSRVTGV